LRLKIIVNTSLQNYYNIQLEKTQYKKCKIIEKTQFNFRQIQAKTQFGKIKKQNIASISMQKSSRIDKENARRKS